MKAHSTLKRQKKTDYEGLGLSKADIALLRKYNLTYLLDKIKDQQHLLEKHEYQLEEALSKVEKDLNAAREAQMNLLPKELVGIPHIEFKARFFPSQYVSGDIYNIFRLDEEHIGVYHIDISGHGVPAALFSVSLSQMLNANISQRNLLKVPVNEPPYYRINPPDRVIAILNDDQNFEQTGIYFTMIYMIINFRTNHITYTRAGHNPPIIIRANGKVEIFEEGCFPVGWNFPREDKVVEFDVESGDRIFMYSDGITETTDVKDNLFGMERLTAILLENRKSNLDKTLDAVLDALYKFSEKDSFEDDVSLIGLAWE